MALDSPIPVRFDGETAKRLKSISDRTDIPIAKLIRMATEAWLDETEKSGKIQISLGGNSPAQKKSNQTA